MPTGGAGYPLFCLNEQVYLFVFAVCSPWGEVLKTGGSFAGELPIYLIILNTYIYHTP